MKKNTGKASSMPAGIAAGEAVGLIILLSCSALLAKLVESEKVAWENVGYGIMAIIILASSLGAWISCGQIKRKMLQVCLLHAVIFWGILMMITLLFFGGKYEAVHVTSILIMGGSMAACLLRGKKGKKKIRRTYR